MKLNWPNFKNRKTPPRTIGRLLVVSLPELGVHKLTAKVDTGAFSGALHATRIRETTSDEGRKQLTFSPLGDAKLRVSVDNFHKRSIKSSNGAVAKRYAFDTDIEIFGERHPITITLTNRSGMKYPMLIGRNFLSTSGFLVDVSIDNK